MTRREIVIKTLAHRRCERVPHNIDLTTAMREKMRRELGLSSVHEVSRVLGNYCTQLNVGSVTGPAEGIIPDIYPRKVGPDTYRDDWGVIWRREEGDDIGVVINPPLKEPELSGFTPPQPLSRAPYLEKFSRAGDDRFRLVCLSSPIFQRAWFLRGFENFLMDLVANERFVRELIEIILAYTTKVMQEALSYEIDGFFLMDDWGEQSGLLISPDMWRTYLKPGMAKLFRMVKDNGVLLFFHSCGNINALIPELIDMGVDVLNPLQPEVMDVYAIKREYGALLSFYGGIGTQKLLPSGTVQDVKADVREKVRTLGQNGGYLLAPAHAVQADVPVENVLALVEEMDRQ